MSLPTLRLVPVDVTRPTDEYTAADEIEWRWTAADGSDPDLMEMALDCGYDDNMTPEEVGAFVTAALMAGMSVNISVEGLG